MMRNWKDKWNERFSSKEYIYGTEPNVFFKEQLDKIKPGKILLPADGEGRNGVYAATQGWDVSIFDISREGRNKATKLADSHKVKLDYKVGELMDLVYTDGEFNVIALIYAHFPPDIRSVYHRILDGLLAKNGKIIFEGFGKKHLEYRSKNSAVGGPPNFPSLFSIEEIKSDFTDYEYEGLGEYEVELNEGVGHVGTGSVIRFVATKK